MPIRFSLHLIPDDLDVLVRRAKLAEEAAFDHLWIAESHLTCRDLYVALTLCILNTSRIVIGPGVTNPVLRDNSITASTMSTLSELAPGRTLLGIGSGDTPVYSLGKKMASLATMRKAVVQIRGLMRGETVDYDGVEVKMPWSKHHVPIHLAAEGPKTLQLSGEVADGVIVGSGIYPETIAWVQDNLATGIQHRDPFLGELDVTYGAMCSVASDGTAAREKLRARVANRAHHNFRMTMESVPQERLEEVQRLMDNFDVREWRSPRYASLITDYLLDRFAISGTPRQCVARIKDLESLGVKRLVIDPPTQDFDASLKMFIEQVMPQFR